MKSPIFSLLRPEYENTHVRSEISSRKEAQEGGYDFDLLGFAGDGSIVYRRCSDGRVVLWKAGKYTVCGKLEASVFRSLAAKGIFDVRQR